MRHVMVRYRVKPDQAARNEELVRAVYAELHEANPAGFRYSTFVLDDGVSFVHLATSESETAPNPLHAIAAFDAFRAGIADRCDEPPVSSAAREIGSFGGVER